MHNFNKNLSIGVLITLALGLVSWMLLFLHPSHGDGKQIVRVRFSNIDKVAVGTPVTFAGQPIGEVKAINLVPEARTNEINRDDEIFSYELTLAIDSRIDVFSTDD